MKGEMIFTSQGIPYCCLGEEIVIERAPMIQDASVGNKRINEDFVDLKFFLYLLGLGSGIARVRSYNIVKVVGR